MHVVSFYLSNRGRWDSEVHLSLNKCFLHLLNPKDGKSLKVTESELHPRGKAYLGSAEPKVQSPKDD